MREARFRERSLGSGVGQGLAGAVGGRDAPSFPEVGDDPRATGFTLAEPPPAEIAVRNVGFAGELSPPGALAR